jgi:hypothetical protein
MEVSAVEPHITAHMGWLSDQAWPPILPDMGGRFRLLEICAIRFGMFWALLGVTVVRMSRVAR